MKQYERDRLLERIERDGATVGASIPETLTVDDKAISLASFVHEASAGDHSKDAIEEVVRGLRAERQRRREQIKSAELSLEDGERLADSILGIDRALTVLQSDSETDIEAESARRRQADRKRWLTFIEKVTGKETSNSHGGHK